MIFSPRSSIVRKFSSGLCLALATVALSVSQVIAAPYVFAPFDVTATDVIDGFVLAPTPVGETYTAYSVTLDWEAIAGDPLSSEAFIAFGDDLNNPTVINLFLTPPDNGSDDDFSTTLVWNGFFDTAYVGGDPISFVFQQDSSGSSAQWSNVSITFDTAEIVTPPSITLTVPQPAESPTFITGNLAAGEVVWFDFIYTGGEIQFDTLGSVLPDEGDGPNDTELAIFDSLGGFIFTNDDIAPPDIRESGFVVPENGLTVGETYYIALGGFNTTFADGFVANSTSTLVGTYQLNVSNITVVPEAGTDALLGFGGLLGVGMTAIKRRRKPA